MNSLYSLNDSMFLRCAFNEKEIAKSVSGCKWSAKEKAWEYPLRTEVFEEITELFHSLSIDTELKKKISLMLASEEEVAKTKKDGWENAEPIEPIPLTSKPFNHQILGYNLGLRLDNLGLLMEQGTGKTYTAIAIAGRRFLRGEVKRVLVVAPASVVPVWPREFEEYADFYVDVKALDGPVAKRIKQLQDFQNSKPGVLQVAVVNYEATWRMEDALIDWEPDMIICDESQRIKGTGSRQSKAMHRIGKVAKFRLILTGTPVTQSPLDFFSQYKFLDWRIFGVSYYAFRNRYAVMGGFGGYQIVAYKNLPELIKKAHSVAYRVTKAEAIDLPEAIDQERYCELEASASKVYREMKKDSVTVLSGDKVVVAQNVLAKLLRLCQLTGGFMGDGVGGIENVSSAKLSAFEDTMTDLMDAGKKVVVFARFIPEIAALQKILEDNKWGYAKIDGSVPMKDRGEEVRRFQEEPDCRVFIAQIQTAGLGITLTAADTAIFYSLDFSFANYDQCRARIHRIGQKNACTYIHLIAKGTVDEKILAALKKKKSVADEVVDNWQHYFE